MPSDEIVSFYWPVLRTGDWLVAGRARPVRACRAGRAPRRWTSVVVDRRAGSGGQGGTRSSSGRRVAVALQEGVAVLDQIDHVVVLMLENRWTRCWAGCPPTISRRSSSAPTRRHSTSVCRPGPTPTPTTGTSSRSASAPPGSTGHAGVGAQALRVPSIDPGADYATSCPEGDA